MTDEDLGQFKFGAAAFVKYLIRARAKDEPAFLAAEDYARWGLTQLGHDHRTIADLLELALQALLKLDGKFLDLCESGGFSIEPSWFDEGAAGNLKVCVASFADHLFALPCAIRRAKEGQTIDWPGVAAWHLLPTFREALDELPSPKSRRPSLGGYVTLDQAAASVSRSKRSLERYKKEMPVPDVKGGGGRPSEWLWSELRPWLEKKFGRRLPEHFHAERP